MANNKSKFPYLEAVARQRAMMGEVYDNLNGLRDCGTYEEKVLYNQLRGAISPLFELFEKLERQIIDSNRAAMKIK